MRIGLSALFLLLGLTTPNTIAADLETAKRFVHQSEQARVETFAKAAKAVVCIFADPSRSGGGSGVIIDPQGYGLTNFHVVQEFLDSRRGVGGLSDGRLYPLRVLGIDPGGDIVMFKLEGKPTFDYAPLGDSDDLAVGQWVAAMGNPFLVAEDLAPTITLGIVSGLHRYQEGEGNLLEYADCIQVSTSINPGNSGGPLFDLSGRVVGINGRASFTMNDDRGRVNVGLGYAVTINQIKRFLPTLRAGRQAEHGTLGATVRMISDRLTVDAVQDFSPAERAGVQLGDEVLVLNGRRVFTPNDFNNVLTILPAGWPVAVRVRRDGRIVESQTRLERLSLRAAGVYLVDIDHNHAETRALLARFAAASDMCPSDSPLRYVWRGELRVSNADAPRPFAIDLLVSDADDLELADRDAQRDPLNDAIADEWRRMALPLLRTPRLGLEWQLIDGDEVDGRIANVLERRLASGDYVRWKFDLETDALLEVSFGDEQAAERVRYRPDAPHVFDGYVWPARWTRIDAKGMATVITIDSYTQRSPTSQVASQPTEDPAEDGQE